MRGSKAKLNQRPLKTGIYQLRFFDPEASEKIVKIDPLLVEIRYCQGLGTPDSHNSARL